MSTNNKTRSVHGAKFPLAVGFCAFIVLIGGLGYWSATTNISGAIVSSGVVRVEQYRQVVQHPDGGVVASIDALDGDYVEAGQTLLEFDGSFVLSELKIVESQLYEVQVRSARLNAELEDQEVITFPDELLALSKIDTNVAQQLAGQERQFEVIRLTDVQDASLLQEGVQQIENRIVGTKAQLDALETRRLLLEEELLVQEGLKDRGLSLSSTVLERRTQHALVMGEIGKLTSDIAEFGAQIAALKTEHLKRKSDRRKEAITALQDLQYSRFELAENRLSLLEKVSRLDVKAPVSGIVYGSKVFALASVVQPAATIMYVVPQNQPLVVAARVETTGIDQVHIGQEASLRFTAFDQRETPEIEGVVSKISADVITDEVTNISFYAVELSPKPGELKRLGQQVLIPGMPVEALIKTTDRTPLAYLAKPLTDYFARALRG